MCPALLFRYTHLKLKPATKGDGRKPLISVHTAGLRGRSGPMSPNSLEGGLGGCRSWQSGWMAYFGWGVWVRAQTGRGVGIVAAAELVPASAAHTVCCSSAPAGFASDVTLLLIAVLHWYETHTKKAAMQEQVLTSLIVLCFAVLCPAGASNGHSVAYLHIPASRSVQRAPLA